MKSTITPVIVNLGTQTIIVKLKSTSVSLTLVCMDSKYRSTQFLLHLDISCFEISVDQDQLIKIYNGFCSAVDTSRVVNLGTTTKLCKRNFVPKPHPGHVVVVSRPKIG